MKSRRLPLSRVPFAIPLVAIAVSSAHAGPPPFQDARSLGMGGTGVAAARPSGAGPLNPSLLAADHDIRHDNVALSYPSVNGSYADNANVFGQIDDIGDTLDRGTEAFDQGNFSALQSEAGLLADQLEAVNGDAIRLDLGGGVLLARPSKDLAIGFHISGQVRRIAQAKVAQSDIVDLRKIAGASNLLEVQQELQRLEQNGELELDADGRTLGSDVFELGISFARAFDTPLGTVNVGATPKVVRMHTFNKAESVDEFDLSDLYGYNDSEFETKDTNFNLDVGASADLGPSDQWRIGASVRNVIPRTLKTVEDNGSPFFGQEKMSLDPLLTVGVAHRGPWHTVTADLDLTQNEGIGRTADRQYLSVGGELHLLDWLDVRAGARQNLASNAGQEGIKEETQYTGGLGLSPGPFRMEVGGFYSDEKEFGGSVEFGLAF